MTKQEIIEYVMNTPQNSNPAILKSMLGALNNGNSSTNNTVKVLHAINFDGAIFEIEEKDDEIFEAYAQDPGTIFVITDEDNEISGKKEAIDIEPLGTWNCSVVEIENSGNDDSGDRGWTKQGNTNSQTINLSSVKFVEQRESASETPVYNVLICLYQGSEIGGKYYDIDITKQVWE